MTMKSWISTLRPACAPPPNIWISGSGIVIVPSPARCRHNGRPRLAAAAQQPRQPDAHEAQGRLRVLREAELILAGGRQQVAEVDAGLGSAPIAERRDLRVFEELRSHAGLLRALAWKQERDLRRYSFALTTSRPA